MVYSRHMRNLQTAQERLRIYAAGLASTGTCSHFSWEQRHLALVDAPGWDTLATWRVWYLRCEQVRRQELLRAEMNEGDSQ